MTHAQRLEVLVGHQLTGTPSQARQQARSLLSTVADYLIRNADDITVSAGLESASTVSRVAGVLRPASHDCREVL